MRRHPLLAFVALAYLWTWVTTLPLVLQKRGLADLGLPDAWEALGAFGPCVAAWVVLKRMGDPAMLAEILRGLTRWRLGPGAWFLAVLSPVGFLALAAVLYTVQSGAPPSLEAFATGRFGTLHDLLGLVLVSAVLQALGEEPGWRGYLLPKLRGRWRELPATLLLFPVWWLWHLPFFLGRPGFGLPQFLGFGLGILSASIWLTYLRERTHSLLVAVVWHAALNITRGIALGFSTGMFLAYGLVVAAGAVVIVAGWLARRRLC